MSERTEQRTRVPAKSGVAIEVRAGDLLRVIDVEGKQVADFFAFNTHDLEEALSPTHTRTQNLGLRLKPGAKLYTNLRRPMFEIAHDTVGVHDLVIAPCDRQRYIDGFNMPDHANCRQNCATAMAPYSLSYARVPDAHNWFMNVEVDAEGGFVVREPTSKAGDYLDLRVLMDAIVAVSACPQDMNETNGFNPTDLELVVNPR
jgi:uncharacterized protein YcgI (DUF1989 family)